MGAQSESGGRWGEDEISHLPPVSVKVEYLRVEVCVMQYQILIRSPVSQGTSH